MKGAERIESVADAQHFARRRLPKSLYQAIEGGSANAFTQRENLSAFDRIRFSPKAAVSIITPELRTSVAGLDLAAPIVLGPAGNLRFFHRDGEKGVARAASARGLTMCIGTLTGTRVEEVAAAAQVPPFYQLYPLGDRALAEFALERAKAAGCRALVLTLDAAAHVARERAYADRVFPVFMAGSGPGAMLRFAPQALAAPAWTWDVVRDRTILDAPMACSREGKPMSFLEAFHRAVSPQVPFLTWADFAWIRKVWDGPIIAKGIMRADDALRAADMGASAIVVSNHGGMVCDGAAATLDALPGIVEAVGSQAEVLVDGGIRRGLDVLKALALGARAVLLGHAYVWPLAAAGSAGVGRILDLMLAEMVEGLRYLGCPSVDELGRDYLFA